MGKVDQEWPRQHKCDDSVSAGRWRYRACGKTARAEVGGKWFCKTHDPRIKAARDAESCARMSAENASAACRSQTRDAYSDSPVMVIGRRVVELLEDSTPDDWAGLEPFARSVVEAHEQRIKGPQRRLAEAEARHAEAKARLERLRAEWPNI